MQVKLKRIYSSGLIKIQDLLSLKAKCYECFARWNFLLLMHNVFQNDLSVQHPYNAMTVSRIVFTVCNHDDSSSLLI
jgi:hypothetical protein